MGEYMDAPDTLDLAEIAHQLLQRVTRGRRALLVTDIGEQVGFRRPGEQHGHAAEAAIVHKLRQTEPRLVERRVEAMHVEENVTVRANAPRQIGRYLQAEILRLQRMAAQHGKMLGWRRFAERRFLDIAGAMAGRHGDHRQGIMRTAINHGFAFRAAIVAARRGDEDRCDARARCCRRHGGGGGAHQGIARGRAAAGQCRQGDGDEKRCRTRQPVKTGLLHVHSPTVAGPRRDKMKSPELHCRIINDAVQHDL